MTNLILCLVLQVNTFPQNAGSDRYTMIAPMGRVSSIACSNFQVFALSDEYVFIIDKNRFKMENTIYLGRVADLVAYDQYTSDLWVAYRGEILRLSTLSYSVRTFPIAFTVSRFAVDIDNLYLEDGVAGRRYALDKVMGTLSIVSQFPANLVWSKKLLEGDVLQYPFLSPYFYSDDLQTSQIPFQRYPITALCDDGMNLYVGTDRYGILKYNTVSWQRERIVNGPLDPAVIRARKTDDGTVFISSSGISYFENETATWTYKRFKDAVADVIFDRGEIYVARGSSVLRADGTMEMPVVDLAERILTIVQDNTDIYVGTRSGAYRIIQGSRDPLPFGPVRQAVNVIYAAEEAIYVGTEWAMYRYERDSASWTTVLNIGTKDIIEAAGNVYSLGTNNQLIRHHSPPADTAPGDTGWILLPYFNVYDIDTDGEVVYCATFSGIYYYEPASASYRVVYNLPRVAYEHVFVIDDRILALSKNLIYSLPLEYRD